MQGHFARVAGRPVLRPMRTTLGNPDHWAPGFKLYRRVPVWRQSLRKRLADGDNWVLGVGVLAILLCVAEGWVY